jgi:hypothetical protein
LCFIYNTHVFNYYYNGAGLSMSNSQARSVSWLEQGKQHAARWCFVELLGYTRGQRFVGWHRAQCGRSPACSR